MPSSGGLGAGLRDELLNGEILYLLGGKGADRTMATALQHHQAAQRAGLQTTGTGILPDTNVPDYAVPPPPHGGWQPRRTLS